MDGGGWGGESPTQAVLRTLSPMIARLSLSVSLARLLPMIISVARLLLAMAEPQPKVLNFASLILPSRIFTCKHGSCLGESSLYYADCGGRLWRGRSWPKRTRCWPRQSWAEPSPKVVEAGPSLVETKPKSDLETSGTETEIDRELHQLRPAEFLEGALGNTTV